MIEALDERILIRLSRLDIPQLNATVFAPGHKLLGNQLRGIVEASGLRPAPPDRDLLQEEQHSLSGQRRIDFNSQALPHPFVQNIQRSELPTSIQGTTHEIFGTPPHLVAG